MATRLVVLAAAAACLAALATLGACATAQPKYYDAIVVEAEGREAGAEPPQRALSAAECALPPAAGPCRGYFAYYHFDAADGACRRFTYSGCGGNANRFRSERACEDACAHVSRPQPPPPPRGVPQGEAGAGAEEQGDSCSWERPPACARGCFLVNDARRDCPVCECSEEVRRRLCAQPAVRGHCRALLTRWRYDPAAADCAPFKFGGCDGNANNFRSRDQCLRTCGPHTYEGQREEEEEEEEEEDDDEN